VTCAPPFPHKTAWMLFLSCDAVCCSRAGGLHAAQLGLSNLHMLCSATQGPAHINGDCLLSC
jgi:hypothetical protein